MHIPLDGPGMRLSLVSFAVWKRALAAGAVQPVQQHWDALAARAFLRQHFQGPGEIHRLRAALAEDIANQSGMSDDAILHAGSQHLCSGTWRIAVERPRVAVTTRTMSARGNAAATAEPVAEAAAPAPAPAAATATPAAPVSAPAPAPEWPEATDQVAFASVLQDAARNGTPFCEICARAASERARAQAA